MPKHKTKNETMTTQNETMALTVAGPETTVATIPQSPVGLFRTAEPTEIIERATGMATALKEVVAKQGLLSNIKGKEYPRCEAWTLLGSMLGVFPVLVWSRPVEHGWEARVEARTISGAIIGAAEAQCLRTESAWAKRDDYALRSMAQTRATAKCLRMPLGFIMSLAGYEATPAEEMPHDLPERPLEKPVAPVEKPVAPVEKPTATAASRVKMIDALQAGVGGANRDTVTAYFRVNGMLGAHDEIESIALQHVPGTVRQMEELAERIARFSLRESGEPEAEVDAGEELRGVLEAVSTKTGQSKKGVWTLYGVKIGGVWANTFDDALGKSAEALKHNEVVAYVTRKAKGITLNSLEVA